MAFLFGLPLAATQGVQPTATQQPASSGGWFQRLGDRVLGPDIDQDQRRGLLGQALLSLGAGMMQTGGQGTAGAIGNGIQSGLLALSQGKNDILDRKQRQRYYDMQGGDPAGFRTADMLAKAAGYEPGSEEYKRFMRVAGGLEGRASSAGVGFDTFTDANGSQRPQRNNPRTGSVEIWYDEQQRWVPLGESAAGGTTYTTSEGEKFDVSQVADPHLRQQIIANPQQYGLVPNGGSVQLPDRTQTFTPAPIPGLGRGRRKEDEAGAVASAQKAAELGYLPKELGMRTQAAIQQAGGVTAVQEAAKAQAERTALDVTRTRDANSTLSLLDEAEKILPSATGSTSGAAYDTAAGFFGQSTPGAQATAQLQTIAGQLTSKMPRMQGPQSDRDVELYKQMAGDLANPKLPVETRMAALQTIRVLNEKYASQQPTAPVAPVGNVRRFNPATGRLE